MTFTPATMSSFEISWKGFSYSLLQVMIASLFLALCAQVSIPLWFSPVPLTGQTFGMMMVGALLGRRKALYSVLAYLAEGAIGLPVFAGGHFGLASLVGPTGGYFLGFAAQAYFVGFFLETMASITWGKTMATLLLSCAIQLGLGVLWLSLMVGIQGALFMGLYPFILGEVIKAAAISTFIVNRSVWQERLRSLV